MVRKQFPAKKNEASIFKFLGYSWFIFPAMQRFRRWEMGENEYYAHNSLRITNRKAIKLGYIDWGSRSEINKPPLKRGKVGTVFLTRKTQKGTIVPLLSGGLLIAVRSFACIIPIIIPKYCRYQVLILLYEFLPTFLEEKRLCKVLMKEINFWPVVKNYEVLKLACAHNGSVSIYFDIFNIL